MSKPIGWTPNELKDRSGFMWWKADDVDGSQGTTHVLIPRAELAALRQRAEDAEAMLRAFASGDWLLDESEEGMFLWQPDDGVHIRIEKDASGLPILTDEARSAFGKG